MENRMPVWLYLALLYGVFALISLLVLVTRGRPGFVKKKLLIGGMILTVTGAMTVCSSPIPRTCYARPMDPDYIVKEREGWIDDHTILAKVTLHPDDKYYDTNKKIWVPVERVPANAKIKAIQKILSEFYVLRTKDCKGTCDYFLNVMALQKEFKKPLNEGIIVKETFGDKGEYTVLFRVTERNLKKKVAGENVD